MRSLLIFPTLILPLALTGCGDKDPDEDDEGWGLGADSGDPEGCGNTDGLVFGDITGPYSSDPNPYATVVAYELESGNSTTGEVSEDGTYELNVEGGVEYAIYGYDADCYSSDWVTEIEACKEYPHDIRIEDCDTADKPNLYLYPAQDTPMSVRLHHTDRQRIVASDPPYEDGWRGVAHPDGTFTVDGRRAPFLFYEVSLQPWQSQRFQKSAGWCLPEADAHEAMAELIGRYGFNARERDDFVDGWVHDLPPSPGGYAVYPQLAVEHAAVIELSHPLPIDRLWLYVEDGTGCSITQEPHVVPFDRSGAHGVEWGVVLHGLGR